MCRQQLSRPREALPLSCHRSRSPINANTVDAPAVYVAISRARDSVALYTNSRAKLLDALGLRDGAQVGAIDEGSGKDRSAAIRAVAKGGGLAPTD